MSDRELTAKRDQVVRVQRLADETEVAPRDDRAPTVSGGNPRRLLAAVLQRAERKEGEVRDLVAGGEDAEHAALIAWSIPRLGAAGR